MSSEQCSEAQGSSSPQFALQGDEAVCTGDGFTLTACNWSLGKEDGLSAILSFRNSAANPIRDRVKFGLERSRRKFIAKIPESYQANFESILFSLEEFLRTEGEKDRTEKHETQVEWKCGPYRIVNGAVCRIKRGQDGDTIVPLCNFSAEITAEEIRDDGAEEFRWFVVEGKLADGGHLRNARVPATQFSSMGWVLNQFGSKAVISAGPAAKDSLREAIQLRSENTQFERVYIHTGWCKFNGELGFLTANGVIGLKDLVRVDLGRDLTRYQLPLVAEDPVGAMRTSLKLLRVAPLPITVPLWAGTYRAPLSHWLPLDCSLWVEGLTGALKSSVAANFQSHYGPFDRTSLPGAWSSTANQLERRAFLLKDVLFVIDDYAPSGLDYREFENKASRLLRSQGNLAGRGRLRADLSERPAFPPRGLILSTAEQRPPGQSILARTVLIEIKRGDVNLAALSAAQATYARLPHAMTGFISWLAPQADQLSRLLKESFEGAKARANTENYHLRIPEALAHLWVGLDAALNYAEEIGACVPGEAVDLRAESWEALVELGRRQGQSIEEERPTRRFLRVLFSLLAQGGVVLRPKNDVSGNTQQHGEFLGWLDSDWLYLMPDPVFMVVSRFCRESGELFSTRQVRLKRDLAEQGITKTDADRMTATVNIAGRTRRVLQLNISRIEALLAEKLPMPNHQHHHSGEAERDYTQGDRDAV